jgi:archaellum component FlaC
MTDEEATTRLTLETILERIAALTTAVEMLRHEVQGLRQEFHEFRNETRANFELLGRKLDVLNKDVLEVRARQSLLEDRVEKLERRPS